MSRKKLPQKPVVFSLANLYYRFKKYEQHFMHFPDNVKYLWVLFKSNYCFLMLCYVKATAFAI